MEIGVDTGGTFTDLVARDATGHQHVLKVPSTPDDPSRAVMQAIGQFLREVQCEADTVARVVHGTTVATNAVLERKGARTGLISTSGFGDIIEIGRQLRRSVYELHLTPSTPTFLAPGARRTEIIERVGASGEVIVPLDENSVHTEIGRAHV